MTRRSLDQQIEALRRDKSEIDERLKGLTARKAEQERKAEARRAFLAGRAALERAAEDAGFRAWLMDALDEQLKAKGDRRLFGLGDAPKPAAANDDQPSGKAGEDGTGPSQASG